MLKYKSLKCFITNEMQKHQRRFCRSETLQRFGVEMTPSETQNDRIHDMTHHNSCNPASFHSSALLWIQLDGGITAEM